MSLNQCFEILEHSQITKHKLLDACLALLSYLIAITAEKVEIRKKNALQFFSGDGLRIILFALKNYLDMTKANK